MKTLLTAVALAALATAPALADNFTVSNTAPIIVVDGGETTSNIVVSGTSGTITGLTVSLNGLSHTYPDDLVFGLYNADQNLGFVFMSGVGGSTDVNNINVTFSDFASDTAPESFGGGTFDSGTYLPSNYNGYSFTFYPNTTSFAGYNGFTANGTWTLFVDDVFPADGGNLSGGWALNFTTTTPSVPEPATWAMMIGGMAFAGAAMRRRTSKVAFAA